MSKGTIVRRALQMPFGLVLPLFVTLTLATCSENAAPNEPYVGVLVFAPRITAAEGVVGVTEVQVTLRRVADGTVAKDTVVTLSPNDTTVDIEIALALENPEEQFELTVALIDAAGATVFRGGPVTVTASTGADPVPVALDFRYTGVGANAAGVFILSPDTLITEGDEIVLDAVALDSNETPISGAPVVWRSLDSARVRIPSSDSGRAVGGAERGVARIVARLLTGQADTVLLAAQPAAANLLLESGDGQSMFADSLLPLPLVTRVTAGDGLGVEAVWVRYDVTQGGGTVSADSVLSDGDGLTSVTWRLGAAGSQAVQVTSTALPAATVTFSATATTPPQPVGPQITFFSDSTGVPGSLYRVNGDGSGLTVIQQGSGDYPWWSPSRERVVYHSFNNLIGIAAADGSGSAGLTTTMFSERPRFNSTGQRLAFSCAPSYLEWPDICVVPDVSGSVASLAGIADGDGAVHVMDSIATDATGPGTFAWDPIDPDRIYFFHAALDSISSDWLTWLYASRYDGTGLELLTPAYLQTQGTPLGVESTAEFSPDGQRMLFSGNGALYLINRDGTGLTRLTIGRDAGNPETDYDPRFSPDGLRIAFVRRIRYFNAQATDVWVVNNDGTNPRQLTADQHPYTETRVTVDWSPDGSELVVVGLVDKPNDYSLAVYVIPDTSSTDTYLQVRRRVGRVGDVGAVSEHHPMWRP